MPLVTGVRAVGFTQSRRRYPAFIENLDALVGASFVRRDGTLNLTGTWDVGAQEINNVAKLGIGIIPVDSNALLHIDNGAVAPPATTSDDLVVIDNTAAPSFINFRTMGAGAFPAGMIFSNFVGRRAGAIIYNHNQARIEFDAGFGSRMWVNAGGVRIEHLISVDADDLFQVVSAVGTNSILIRDVDGYVDFQSTTFGLGIPKIAGDPATLVDGDFWYDTVSDTYQGRENGVTVTFTTV